MAFLKLSPNCFSKLYLNDKLGKFIFGIFIFISGSHTSRLKDFIKSDAGGLKSGGWGQDFKKSVINPTARSAPGNLLRICISWSTFIKSNI